MGHDTPMRGEDEPTVVQPGAQAKVPAHPQQVDRYDLTRRLGAGGVGVVFEAWDPKLRRHVAIKLVRERSRDPLGAQRFVREAQALAKLSHPNVVEVFGVGLLEHEATVYVVMRRVDGVTLARWLEGDRCADAIVEVFLQAGRGVAAAHAAGVVHRDFKPSNVMVDGTGKAVVLDFGIAIVSDAAAHTPGSLTSESLERSIDPDGRLTEEGTVVGTPRYMAPEQHAGGSVGPQADQFAFCLSLLQALRRGRGVYPGTTLEERKAAKRTGEILKRHRSDLASPWIERALRRGLDPDPHARWPSMDALLEALERKPHRAARKAFASVALLGLAMGVGVVAPQAAAEPCDAQSHRLTTALEDAGGDLDAVAAGGKGGTASTLEWIRRRTAHEADAWAQALDETCEARDAGELSEASFDRRLACLERAAAARERLLTTLRSAEHSEVRDAPERLLGLDPVEHCISADPSLTDPVPEEPGARGRVAEARLALDRVEEDARAGRFVEASSGIDELLREATVLGFAPLFVEARAKQAHLAEVQGNDEEAAMHLEDALLSAQAAGYDAGATQAASALVHFYARLDRVRDARRALDQARASLARAGTPANLRHHLAMNHANLLLREAKHDEARALLEALVEEHPSRTDAERYALSSVLNAMGLAQGRQGDYDAAANTYQRALSLREEVLGPRHPKHGTLLSNLGIMLVRAENYDEADAALLRAIELTREGYGDDHPNLVALYVTRGVAAKKRGQLDAARSDYEQALALAGEDARPSVRATILGNLGNVERRSGNSDAALRYHQQALTLREAALGPDSVDVAMSLGDIGVLHRDAGRYARAREHYERSRSIYERVHGTDHVSMIDAHVREAQLGLDEGELGQARASATEALRVVHVLDEQTYSAVSAWCALGRVELTDGAPTKAIDAFGRGIVMAPEGMFMGRCRLDFARALESAGRPSDARAMLDDAIVELSGAEESASDDLAEARSLARRW